MECYELFNKDNNAYPIVISIPHSGTYVPGHIRDLMKPSIILTNSDWYLPELYSFLPAMGLTIIKSNISRYVIDLNRDINGSVGGDYHNLVYELTTQNRPIYNAPLQMDDVKQRIQEYYLPYHNALERLIKGKLEHHRKVYLFDLHSFFLNFTDVDDGDIILSNLDHTTASPKTVHILRTELEKTGFIVTENTIKGGYITSNYGMRFGSHVESIQVELRYTAYLENRYFGEEEVKGWDEVLFSATSEKIKQALTNSFEIFYNME